MTALKKALKGIFSFFRFLFKLLGEILASGIFEAFVNIFFG